MKKFTFSYRAITLLAGLGVAAGACAQEVAAPALEEVLVQARRVTESQQAVPIAVSTISADALREATATSIDDIQRLLPALQITPSNTGQQAFVIRGSFAIQFTDPGVITYVDEVPVDSKVTAYALHDIASVQQLKGAQGTLFGKNSTGGAVLFFAQRPTNELDGYIQARYGRLDERRFEGAFNLPVTDTLALRFSGQMEKRDGMVEGATFDYDDRDNFSLRGAGLWKPTERLENYTQITHYGVRQQLKPNLITSVDQPGLVACTTQPAQLTPPICFFQQPLSSVLGTPDLVSLAAQQNALGREHTVNTSPYPDRLDYDAITNSTTFDFGLASVKNIFHFSDTGQTFGRDYDGTPAVVYETTIDSQFDYYYDELQLFGAVLEGKLNWRVGATYSNTEGGESFTTRIYQPPGAPSPISPGRLTNNTDSTSKAAFTQVSYEFLEGVTGTVGYRKTRDSRAAVIVDREGSTATGQQFVNCGLPASPDADLVNCVRRLDDDFEDSNYNLTLDWQVTDKLLTYVSRRKGYKSGGFNVSQPDPSLTAYDSEVVKDLELGLKSDWRLGQIPLRTNVALFRSKYTNIQAPGLVINQLTGEPSQVIFNRTPNGGDNKATFEGFEVEVGAALTGWLNLSAFYSQVDATYDTFINSSGRDLSDQNVSGVFPKSYGATARFDVPVPNAWGQLAFTTNYYFAASPLENPESLGHTESSDRVDARLDLQRVAGTNAELSLYGKNLTDEFACGDINLGLGAPYLLCNGGRAEYGLEVRYSFGDK